MYVRWFIGFLLTANMLQGLVSDQFNEALEAQKKKQYHQAFDLYCVVPVKTGNVLFNMGLVAYYEGQYVKALALWRTACLTNSMFDSYQLIKHASAAIAWVKQEQLVPAECAGHPADDSRFVYHILFLFIWYLHVIPLWIFQLLVVIISLLVCGLLLCVMHNAMQRRWLLVCIFLPFIILVGMAMYNIKVRTSSYAIVQEAIEMHRGPGDFFEPAGKLYPLTELLIEARASLWCKVRYQDKIGWVPEKALYIIDDHTVCGIDIVNRSENH